MRLIVLDPGKPESKGQVERTNGYLEASFLPLREFTDLHDLQSQHDAWSTEVAFGRHHRRVGGRVGDALVRRALDLKPATSSWTDPIRRATTPWWAGRLRISQARTSTPHPRTALSASQRLVRRSRWRRWAPRATSRSSPGP